MDYGLFPEGTDVSYIGHGAFFVIRADNAASTDRALKQLISRKLKPQRYASPPEPYKLVHELLVEGKPLRTGTAHPGSFELHENKDSLLDRIWLTVYKPDESTVVLSFLAIPCTAVQSEAAELSKANLELPIEWMYPFQGRRYKVYPRYDLVRNVRSRKRRAIEVKVESAARNFLAPFESQAAASAFLPCWTFRNPQIELATCNDMDVFWPLLDPFLGLWNSAWLFFGFGEVPSTSIWERTNIPRIVADLSAFDKLGHADHYASPESALQHHLAENCLPGLGSVLALHEHAIDHQRSCANHRVNSLALTSRSSKRPFRTREKLFIDLVRELETRSIEIGDMADVSDMIMGRLMHDYSLQDYVEHRIIARRQAGSFLKTFRVSTRYRYSQAESSLKTSREIASVIQSTISQRNAFETNRVLRMLTTVLAAISGISVFTMLGYSPRLAIFASLMSVIALGLTLKAFDKMRDLMNPRSKL